MSTERTDPVATETPDTDHAVSRRTFLGTVVGCGLSMSLCGCASVMAVPVRSAGGTIRIVPVDHPDLTDVGGKLSLRDQNSGQLLYLLALDDGSFTALSSICTHQGCTVDVEGQHLVCPCHGSTYTRRGEVVRGPASRPLQSYPVRIEPGGALVIEMEDG